MRVENTIANSIGSVLKELYGIEEGVQASSIQKTRKEFDGDFTFVVFPYVKLSRKSPEQTAQEIGGALKQKMEDVAGFNVVKGFLNISLSAEYWKSFFASSIKELAYGHVAPDGSAPYVLEFSSPNTNKPLHLGHIRNNLLGHSVAEILKASGKIVIRVNLVNDRGIHICKSMLAWMKWGEGINPRSAGKKGDHLVGDFYVLFDKKLKAQIEEMAAQGIDKEEAGKTAPLLLEAQALLKRWEDKDPDVIAVWEMMNAWVYEGFDQTYQRLGIQFEKTYHESQTYLLGKSLVEEGLAANGFFRKEDGSVWCDLTDQGLDQKLLLRSDGTSVYITQDLGTAQLRYDDFHPQKMIYVVGNEQNYHFDVLQKLLVKLGRPFADAIYHLSYGMVELPQGRMKSREGTVVDADDLMDEMIQTARSTTEELGKLDDFKEDEKEVLFDMLGLGALKYFILKVDPKKNMLFNPEESIDFNGNTGPFIQYTHARIRSVVRKAVERWPEIPELDPNGLVINEKELSLLKLLYDYPIVVQQAALDYSPAQIANYGYELAKEFNQFYHDYSILKEANETSAVFRLHLALFTGRVIKQAMSLLGIEVPERM